MKNLESSGTINRDTIKLTPPVSDNEEEEEGGGGGEEDNDDEGISLPSTLVYYNAMVLKLNILKRREQR